METVNTTEIAETEPVTPAKRRPGRPTQDKYLRTTTAGSGLYTATVALLKALPWKERREMHRRIRIAVHQLVVSHYPDDILQANPELRTLARLGKDI